MLVGTLWLDYRCRATAGATGNLVLIPDMRQLVRGPGQDSVTADERGIKMRRLLLALCAVASLCGCDSKPSKSDALSQIKKLYNYSGSDTVMYNFKYENGIQNADMTYTVIISYIERPKTCQEERGEYGSGSVPEVYKLSECDNDHVLRPKKIENYDNSKRILVPYPKNEISHEEQNYPFVKTENGWILR